MTHADHSSPADSSPEEIELKFEIAPADLDAVRTLAPFAEAGAESESEVAILESVYWDTPEADLASLGLTLRVRRDGLQRLQTVKTHGGSGLIGRGEWESDIEGDAPDLGRLAGTPVEGRLSAEALASLGPLFSTRITRTRRRLHTQAGEVEVALDEGEVRAGDAIHPLLELEVELKCGEPGLLFETVRPWLDQVPLRLSFTSKAERGYALAGASLPASAPTFDGEDAAAGVQAVLRHGLGVIDRQAEALLARPDPQTVHRLRVAVRRLRVVLGTLSAFGDDPGRSRLDGDLRWLAGELDEARDLDVLLADTLAPAETAAAPEAAQTWRALVERVEAARDQAATRAATALVDDRFRRLLFEGAAWGATGPWLAAARARGTDFATEALEAAAKRVRRRARALKSGDAAARHHLRIAAKKLRYTAEAFGDARPSPIGLDGRGLRRLRKLQDGLGALNDLAVSRRVLERALGVGAPADQAFIAGELIGRRTAVQRAGLKRTRRAWRRLRDVLA